MKYFIDAEKRIASGCKNYIEFQPPGAKEEFWDATSLYMHENTMFKTGFYAFLSSCMYKGIVFDMNCFTRQEMLLIAEDAKEHGEAVLEVMDEFVEWAGEHLVDDNQSICLNWEADREYARRYKLDNESKQEKQQDK